MSAAEVPEGDRSRAYAAVRRHGHATTSFQTLGRGLSYRFFGSEAYVAFADTGAAWVAAGPPVAPPGRVADVAHAFVQAAHQHGRRARFFGVHQDVGLSFLRQTPIGEEPLWRPGGWADITRRVRSLREQLRRSRAKGVHVARVDPAGRLRHKVEKLAHRWLRSRPMAPMGFMVQLDPFHHCHDRLYFVAERHGSLVGLLVASPIPAGRGWFVEHLLRDPAAPNGTVELLVDALMRHAAGRGDALVSLGLAPLAGPVSAPLRWARRLGRPLYDFRGLERFKRKLRPHRVATLYLAYPASERGFVAMLDVLTAFAPGGLVRFGLRTLRKATRRGLPWPRRTPPRLPSR